MSKLSTGATFVVAQVLAVAVGVGGTTYVHAHEDDARKKKSLAKQIQAQVRAMAPTLTVGAAVNATNATHAANSDRVGGALVQRVSLRVTNSATFPSLVSINGLNVKVGCQSGKSRMEVSGAGSGGVGFAAAVSKLETSSQSAAPVASDNGSGTTAITATDTAGTFVAAGRRSDGTSVYVSVNYNSTSTYCDFSGLSVTS